MKIPNKFNRLGITINQYLPLTLTANQSNSTVKITCLTGILGQPIPEGYQIKSTISGLQYRTNQHSNWIDYTLDSVITLSNINDYVQFRNTANKLSDNYITDHVRFVMTGSISAHGNLRSMLNFSNTLTNSCFYALFKDCIAMVKAPDLIVDNAEYDCCDKLFRGCTNLTVNSTIKINAFTGGYSLKQMFYGCTGLLTVPENSIKIANIKVGCCISMFQGCSNLVSVPDNLLTDSSIPDSCFYDMFNGCSSLTTAPKLPATTLGLNCYKGMFARCSNLVNVSPLPATILVSECYRNMFYDCSKLAEIEVNFTDWNTANNATDNWLYGVSATGTFIKPSALAEQTGSSYIPSEWNITNK